MSYAVSEMVCALQGEGARAGTRNVFIRFVGCNLRCVELEHGFDCDTDFLSVYKRFPTESELVEEVNATWGDAVGVPSDGKAVILTGGEPALQTTDELVNALQEAGYYVAIETNGTKPLPAICAVDWISCSPKTAEHTLSLKYADELRYVRATRQGIPKPVIASPNHYLSPAASADGVRRENLEWCLNLIEQNPTWKLSVQMHKLWGLR